MVNIVKNVGLVIKVASTGGLNHETLDIINGFRSRCMIYTNIVNHARGKIDPMVKILTGTSTDEAELINIGIVNFPKNVGEVLFYDVKTSGITQTDLGDFDPVTYMKLNPDIVSGGFNTEALAIAHWKQYGRNENRATQPPRLPNNLESLDVEEKYQQSLNAEHEFDYTSYLLANPDLLNVSCKDYPDGISTARMAYDHWKTHGQKEGRPIYPNIVCKKKCPVPGSRYNKSIAIILTLYYKDIIYELADYINRLPFNATIYVSSPEDRYINTFKSILTNQTIIQTPYVGFGMDIGNYITQIKYLRDKNIKHDYYLKIHSKRNLQWRRCMFESLLPTSLDDYLSIFKLLDQQHIITPGLYTYPHSYNRANMDINISRLNNIGIDSTQVYPPVKYASNAFDAESYLKSNYDLKRLFANYWNNGNKGNVLKMCTEHYNRLTSEESSPYRLCKKVINKIDNKFAFSAGTMFWFDTTYLESFIDKTEPIDDLLNLLSTEKGKLVNDKPTQTHSLEYWFGIVAGLMNKDKIISTKSINFILPSLDKNTKVSGGFRTVLRHAEFLRSQNYNVTLQVITKDLTKQREYLSNFNIFTNIKDIQIYNDSHTCYTDIHVATGWQTFTKCLEYEADGQNTCWFCQDLEYKFDINHLPVQVQEHIYNFYTHTRPTFTMSKYLEHTLKNMNTSEVVSTQLLVNNNVYKNITKPSERAGICLLYDSDKSHRLPGVTIFLMEKLSKKFPHENIYLYGNTRDLTDKKLPSNVHNLGIVTPARLNKLYNQCKIGTCFSTTNPSRVGFEMITSGCLCVEIDCETTKKDLPADVFLLRPKDPNIILDTIETVISDDTTYKKLYSNLKKIKPQSVSEEQLFANMLTDVFYQ